VGIPESAIISLNKSRQRAVYWREDSQGNWVKTTPLPADPASINYYFLKGFKANPPKGDNSNGGEPTGLKDRLVIQCPICGFETQSAFGLQAHLRKHINKEKSKNKEVKT